MTTIHLTLPSGAELDLTLDDARWLLAELKATLRDPDAPERPAPLPWPQPYVLPNRLPWPTERPSPYWPQQTWCSNPPPNYPHITRQESADET